jgi:quercetin dioxygenase-like cupin family protein
MERSDDADGAERETHVPRSVRPVDLRDYARFDPERATRVRVLATDVLTVDLWCLEPQQSTDARHLAEVDVAYTVLGGHAWFVTDEGEIGLGPLGSMLVPAGVAHGIDNRTVDPVVGGGAAPPPPAGPPPPGAGPPPRAAPADAVWLPGERRGLLGGIKRLLDRGD